MNTRTTCSVIDLTPLGGRVYVGRPNGEAARRHFKIELLEESGSFPIEVIFPDSARTITSSFFLGMFGNSVRVAGTQEAFLNRFKFKANSRIENEIKVAIQEALSSR